MRESKTNYTVHRYARQRLKTEAGTYLFDQTLENSILNFQGSYVKRSDIVKNPSVNGWRPPSPYLANGLQADTVIGDIIVQSAPVPPFWEYTISGKVDVNTDVLSSTVTSLDINPYLPTQNDINASVVKARNNVADRAASFAESIAEASQTLKGLGDLAKNIDDFLVSAVRKDWRRAALSLKLRPADRRVKSAIRRLEATGGTLSAAWLAFNFGIKPIISDMVSIAILLSDMYGFRVTGSTVHLTEKSDTTVPRSLTVPYGIGQVVFDEKVTVKAGVHTRLDFEISEDYLRTFSKFGVTDVVQVGWALVPLSFMVDFVLPVSEVLKSLTATVGLRFKGGSSTSFVRLTKLAANPRLVTDKVVKTATFYPNTVEGFDMKRSVYQTEPNPVALWVKDPFGAFEVLTTFAVLGQRLSNSFKYK